MRIIFLYLVLHFSTLISYSQNGRNCSSTIDVKAGIFPDNSDSLFTCPIGACCYSYLKSRDKRFEIISFKLSALKLCGVEEEQVLEADNIGSAFSAVTKIILSKACSGSILQFNCIKAKGINGMVYILQPFSMELK